MVYREQKVTYHSAAVADANGAAIPTAGFSSVGLQVTGTSFVSTVYFEATLDGTNWVAVLGVNTATGAVASNTTAVGMWQIPILNWRRFRARLDWTSGTATVTAIFSEGDVEPLADVLLAANSGVDIGDVDVLSIAAGTNNIGDVDVASIAAGTNNIGDVDIASIAAGETHIGEVGCNTTVVSVTPTVTAGGYTALDIVGAIQTIAAATRVSGEPTILQSITVTDLNKQNVELTIFFFNANPGTGTYTDNLALTIHDTDMALCIGEVQVLAADYRSAAASSVATIANIGLPLMPAATSLFAIAQASGAAPTYASVSDLVFKYGFLRD